MNERIGKLAVKAGAHWEHGDWNMPSAVYFSERDLEKFARLIVQECIDIAQDRANFPGFPPNDVNHIIDEIREHFGVEE